MLPELEGVIEAGLILTNWTTRPKEKAFCLLAR